MSKTILVKVVLKGEDAKKFQAVKAHHGVLHNSEVIRIVVNNSYEELKEAK